VTVRLCSYYNARLYPIVRGVRGMNRLLGRSSGAAGTDFNVPRPAVNRILERTFAGEAATLVKVIRGKRRQGYRTGVSLIALLRREPGPVKVRPKPDSVEADVYNPQQRTLETTAV
jgi:hypothetical protein